MTYKFYQRLKQPEPYRYSDAMLKHMPKDALETFENTLLYSRKKVKLATKIKADNCIVTILVQIEQTAI